MSRAAASGIGSTSTVIPAKAGIHFSSVSHVTDKQDGFQLSLE